MSKGKWNISQELFNWLGWCRATMEGALLPIMIDEQDCNIVQVSRKNEEVCSWRLAEVREDGF